MSKWVAKCLRVRVEGNLQFGFYARSMDVFGLRTGFGDLSGLRSVVFRGLELWEDTVQSLVSRACGFYWSIGMSFQVVNTPRGMMDVPEKFSSVLLVTSVMPP